MNPWQNVAQGYQHGLDQNLAIQQQGMSRQDQLFQMFMEGYTRERQMQMQKQLQNRQLQSQEAAMLRAHEQQRHNEARERQYDERLKMMDQRYEAERLDRVSDDLADFPGYNPDGTPVAPHLVERANRYGLTVPQPQMTTVREAGDPLAQGEEFVGPPEPIETKQVVPGTGMGHRALLKRQEGIRKDRELVSKENKAKAQEILSRARANLANAAASLTPLKRDLMFAQIDRLDAQTQSTDDMTPARLALMEAQINALMNPVVGMGATVAPRPAAAPRGSGSNLPPGAVELP
jgi:hypothetical protein